MLVRRGLGSLLALVGATACVGPLSIDFARGPDAGALGDDAGITAPDADRGAPPAPPPPVDGGGPTPFDAGALPTLDAGPPLAPLAPPEARYHSFEEVEAFVGAIAARHPDRIEAGRYGTSPGGRPLLTVHVTDRVGVDEGEPEVLINYAIHGDEIIVVECALDLLYTLAERYDEDPRVRDLVDTYDLWIVPVVSPDGFAARSREVGGVDPNREFPYPEDPDRRPIPVIEAAVRFFEAHRFAGTLDFHAFGELVLLPYGASFDRPPTWTALSDVARELAAVGGYEPVQISTLLGGLAIGGSVDYYLWRGGGIHLAVEMATSKAPPTSEIPTLRRHGTEMALRFVASI